MPALNANGVTLAYESEGNGPPLLLIAGLGYGGSFWRFVVPELSHQVRAIWFDNRGVGGSDKPEGPYSTRMMADDAAALMDALGIESAHVLGHSLGGMIAQELALAYPNRVRSLVLASTVGGPNGIPITPEALQVMTNRQGDPIQIFRRGIEVATAPGFAEKNPERVGELLKLRMSTPLTPASYQAQLTAGATHDAEARLGQLACRTLLLTGDEDKVVPPGNVDLLARRIPGSRAVRIPGAGHLLFAEVPEAAASAVLRFVVEA